jgi:hypothetical protein
VENSEDFCPNYVQDFGLWTMWGGEGGKGRSQSNELTRGTTDFFGAALSFLKGGHIGVRALLFINLIWFGYIARLSQWGGGGIFHSFK